MISFQYYSNEATNPKPIGYVGLDRFLSSIKDPSEEVKSVLLKIQKAAEEGDNKRKSELKKQLYAFTPCSIVKERRAYSDIIKFTGLTVLDFDKIDYAEEFKYFLFNTYSSVIAAWLSPSKKGIKALVKIPKVETIDEYKSYFYGLASEMQMYKGFDATTQNAVLLLFIGWDKDILVRDNYTEWNIKGIKANEFSKSICNPVNIEVTNKQSEWVTDWIRNKINSISDNGHPQVRDNCVSLGGYVASGYVDYYDAVNLVNYLIATNNYLQKGISGYQKTARESIDIGMQKPLTFN